MREADFRNMVIEYSAIVESVEMFQLSEEEKVSQLKAKLRLTDASILRVREIRIKETPEAYSYYWLNPDETVIMGWDNAPHHKSISTFPHHRHIGNDIEVSEERNLSDVLNFIRNLIG